MKIAWIGHMNDPTEYGEASVRYLLALQTTNAEIAHRSIRFGPTKLIDPRIECLGSRRLETCDVLVQHTLPIYFTYSKLANITVGLFGPETNPLPPLWIERCSLVDIVGVHTPEQRNLLGYRTLPPLPVPCDIDEYLRTYTPPPEAKATKEGGHFTFYTIAELSKRKNISGLVRAFYGTFRPEEPVRLLIKSSGPIDPVVEICTSVRQSLGLRSDDKRVVVSTRTMTRNEILGLHHACDVYVQPSFAEWWGIDTFDAMAMGKTPIASNVGGPAHYLNDNVGWLIPTRQEPVYAETTMPGGLYRVGQNWNSPDLIRLQKCMREAFEDRDKRSQKALNGLDQAAKFDLTPMGALFLEVLGSYVTKKHSRTGTGVSELARSA